MRLPRLERDGWLIVGGKAARSFAFGLSSVALGLYLAELRLPGPLIGLVFSAALAGTMGLTLLVALWGDRIGGRRLLLVGASLMLLGPLIPLCGADPAVLLPLALTGSVAVTASESSGLQSIDQALLAGAVEPRERTSAFGLYAFVASAATALGALSVGGFTAAGAVLGLEGAQRHAPAFVGYAFAGLVAALLAARLAGEAAPAGRVERRLPIARSRPIVARLAALFALDSLASGFVVQSFLALWFATRFALDAAAVGALFFTANVLAALSFPAAVWLAGRLGLIRTMVFTHIPASCFLIAMAVVPSVVGAAALFLARAALASMDVPARNSYTMAVVDTEERTAAAAVTNLARSGAQAAGPVLAGSLLLPLGIGVPLVACGLLKIAYDLALFAAFRSLPAPEEVGR